MADGELFPKEPRIDWPAAWQIALNELPSQMSLHLVVVDKQLLSVVVPKVGDLCLVERGWNPRDGGALIRALNQALRLAE